MQKFDDNILKLLRGLFRKPVKILQRYKKYRKICNLLLLRRYGTLKKLKPKKLCVNLAHPDQAGCIH